MAKRAARGRTAAAATRRAKYRIKDERDVFITMRDGVRIALRIYRPDAPGRFPVLFAASPYQYDSDDQPHSPLFLTRETGPIRWYVEEQGYVYVRADTRGSGRSEGTFGLLDAAEQQDLYETIEWIARQDWCDGNVGGIGQSYYCWTQWFMGIVNPPHLRCIGAYDGSTDLYRDVVYHGGMFCPFLPNWYQGLRVANIQRPANRMGGKEMTADIGGEMARHQTDDDWWRERSAFPRLGEIKVPTLSIGHWGKIGLHLRGNVMAYEEIKAPGKKLLVTGARGVFEAHDMYEQVEFHETELLPFYDRYLKGVKNGWEKRAAVRFYVNGAKEWREEADWPLKRAKPTPYYLSAKASNSVTSLNDGSLTTDAPSRAGGETRFRYPDPKWMVGTAVFGPQGPDVTARTLSFTSAPLEEDVEAIGTGVVELHASSTEPDTDFIVRLVDQAPQDAEARKKGLQPPSTVVSKGWLRASHREKDAARSTPMRPFYTHKNPQPLAPGEVYTFEIELQPMAHRFVKGHRIRLELANADSALTETIFSHQYLGYKVGTDTIHHSAARPSRVILPVVPRK
jgi:putative CocE/NonD family hydrolase